MAENIFEKVLENVDIVDVVRGYVDLEPKGKNLFGICPFHDDHSPSMSVSREKGIFYCFTCHEGGNAIKFVEKIKHISPIEAAKLLADQYHIDVSEFKNESSASSSINKYYNAMDTASKFYSFLMNDSNISKEAREYLHKRGISDKTIDDFKIGLSINDNHALTKTLESKGYLKSDLIITSLANENEDLFVDRIMVPIRNESGRVVAFGGRIYKEDSKELSKYMNSKETPIFKKGETIFNLDKAQEALKTTNYLIVNEGYMDVITSYSNGVKNAVAIMGTNITDEQVSLLKKYTKNIAICLDGDKPGMEGVKNLIRGFEKANMNYSITILPNDMDPDEFIRKNGIEAYKDYITNKRLDKMGYIYEVTKRSYGEITTFNLETFKNEIFRQMKDENSRSTIEANLRKLSFDIKVSYESLRDDYLYYIGQIKPKHKNVPQVQESNKFSVQSAFDKAQEIVVNYSIKDKSYFNLIEDRMSSRLFLKNKELRKAFIAIGDIYDYFGFLGPDEVLVKLNEKDIQSINYDPNYAYSMEDLENILKIFKKESLKEEISIIKSRLKNDILTKDEMDELLKNLQTKQREIKKI